MQNQTPLIICGGSVLLQAFLFWCYWIYAKSNPIDLKHMDQNGYITGIVRSREFLDILRYGEKVRWLRLDQSLCWDCFMRDITQYMLELFFFLQVLLIRTHRCVTLRDATLPSLNTPLCSGRRTRRSSAGGTTTKKLMKNAAFQTTWRRSCHWPWSEDWGLGCITFLKTFSEWKPEYFSR